MFDLSRRTVGSAERQKERNLGNLDALFLRLAEHLENRQCRIQPGKRTVGVVKKDHIHTRRGKHFRLFADHPFIIAGIISPNRLVPEMVCGIRRSGAFPKVLLRLFRIVKPIQNLLYIVRSLMLVKIAVPCPIENGNGLVFPCISDFGIGRQDSANIVNSDPLGRIDQVNAGGIYLAVVQCGIIGFPVQFAARGFLCRGFFCGGGVFRLLRAGLRGVFRCGCSCFLFFRRIRGGIPATVSGGAGNHTEDQRQSKRKHRKKAYLFHFLFSSVSSVSGLSPVLRSIISSVRPLVNDRFSHFYRERRTALQNSYRIITESGMQPMADNGTIRARSRKRQKEKRRN